MKFFDLASWWDDDYDFESHEWLSDNDDVDARETMTLMTSEYDDISSAFSRWYSFEDILTLMSAFEKNKNDLYLS